MNQEISHKIASYLLEIEAVKFNFEEPFTWASGVKSPVYCDNRLALSYVELRSLIRDAYIELIKQEFPQVEIIAGVATGAIAQGALVADRMNLSFIYVRAEAKKYGQKKTIEGILGKGQKTVILEDHISTGKSSIKVLENLREEGADVLGMVATLSYGLPLADENFKKNNCKLFTLSEFSTLIAIAVENGYINKEDLEKMHEWLKNPTEYYQ